MCRLIRSVRFRRVALLLLGSCLSNANLLAAGPLDRWNSRSLTNDFVDLWSIAYGNQMFVALGYEPAPRDPDVWTSRDGSLWIGHSSGASNALGGITYGNGWFVAVGDDFVQRSTNGMNWTSSSAPRGLKAGAAGGGRAG